MIRCEALETFTLGRFDELTDIERAGVDEKGKLNTGDKFTCPKELADYLLGGNRFNKAFVKVIEIIPEKIEEPKIIKLKPSKDSVELAKATIKATKKKTSKKRIEY